MFNNEGYSLADIAAATGKNNGDGMWGDGGSWWIIILFLFIFAGWNGNGNGVFGGGGSTGSGITDGYILTSDFATVERKLDDVNNGICSLGYDQLGQMNGINQNIFNQGTAITAGITALGNQLQSCCCDMRYENASKFADLNYRLAEQSCQTRQTIADSTASLIANQDANTRSILDFLTQDKIASLQAENQSLKFAASQAAQNNYLIQTLQPAPQPAYVVPNPYAAYGYGCGCTCAG